MKTVNWGFQLSLRGLLVMAVLASSTLLAAEEPSGLDAGTFAGLKLRNIGPALKSGRVSDIVKDPSRPSTWYVTVASGNAWKTVNNGTTWAPIFDNHGSYSVGCIAMDPQNSQVLWLGTGENNSQRSVGYGDGVY